MRSWSASATNFCARLKPASTEINTAATSPFLYRRIRVRIEAEERRLAEQRGAWQALLTGVKRAIPVMAMLAIVAFASLIMRQTANWKSRRRSCRMSSPYRRMS